MQSRMRQSIAAIMYAAAANWTVTVSNAGRDLHITEVRVLTSASILFIMSPVCIAPRPCHRLSMICENSKWRSLFLIRISVLALMRAAAAESNTWASIDAMQNAR